MVYWGIDFLSQKSQIEIAYQSDGMKRYDY